MRRYTALGLKGASYTVSRARFRHQRRREGIVESDGALKQLLFRRKTRAGDPSLRTEEIRWATVPRNDVGTHIVIGSFRDVVHKLSRSATSLVGTDTVDTFIQERFAWASRRYSVVRTVGTASTCISAEEYVCCMDGMIIHDVSPTARAL